MEVTKERFEKYCDTAMCEQINDIFDRRCHTLMYGRIDEINDTRKAIMVTMIINRFTKILSKQMFKEEE